MCNETYKLPMVFVIFLKLGTHYVTFNGVYNFHYMFILHMLRILTKYYSQMSRWFKPLLVVCKWECLAVKCVCDGIILYGPRNRIIIKITFNIFKPTTFCIAVNHTLNINLFSLHNLPLHTFAHFYEHPFLNDMVSPLPL